MAARISLSAQLEAALLRANKAEAELLDLKKINAVLRTKAYPHHQAKGNSNSKPNTHISMGEKAKAYCAAHGVKSCTRDQVLAWVP